MYYRILTAPPGYPEHCNYMVGAYRTLEYTSCIGGVLRPDGSRFVNTIEEARDLIPGPKTAIPFEPDAQFVELWESDADMPRLKPKSTY